MAVVLLVIYCLLILIASLVGGWIPIWFRLTHRRMQLAVSLVAGVMLGVALLHLLPHAILEAPDAVNAVFTWTMVGFLLMFFLERFFCYHHHDVPQVGLADETDKHPGSNSNHEDSKHDDSDHANCPHARSDSHPLTWSGAAVGLTLHTVIAGVALAASVQVASTGDSVSSLAGFGTFLVILLHKPFDSMTIGTLMAVGGWSTTSRHVVNGLFALMIPLGVVLFYLGLGHSHAGSHLVAFALAFSAGTFLCIAMSDLLPELQFHSHDRGALSLALLLGLSIALGISTIESRSHANAPHPPNGPVEHLDENPPKHHGHDDGHKHAP